MIFTDLQKEELLPLPPPTPRDVSDARSRVRSAESRLFAARADLLSAEVALNAARADFNHVVAAFAARK
jgi:outer membrane protein TolC